MCELFGVNTPRKIQLNHLLDVFFSHGDKHPHGWGMAFFENDAVRLEKQAVASPKSARLRECIKRRIMADRMIAHIRLATKGNMEYENCHPFIRTDAAERFGAADDLICQIAEGNKLNLLFFDAEYLYVHTNCRDSLYVSERQGGYVFSTVPLDDQQWNPLPLNTLLAYRNGRRVRTGTDHGREYMEDPEKMRLLFLDYSTL